MGASMRQELQAIADAYEGQQKQIMALQRALLRYVISDSPHCGANGPCNAYKDHPAPWHAEKCGCACEAREAYIAARDVTS